MNIETQEVRKWINNYLVEFEKLGSPFEEGIVMACNGLLKLLTNYEEMEGRKIAEERGEI